MNIEVINSESKEMSLSMKDADIGLLYVIQHELLKQSSVDFAGVIVKHPLKDEIWMRISSNSKPLGEIKKATDTAIKISEEFKKLINSKIQVS
ncbi:MAG: DNA-directed RNA polymerase subunit L [Nitrosopumilus sp.]|nr:DNA-directed RNA polymerase subunit L [Nitrosopumilus sp.]